MHVNSQWDLEYREQEEAFRRYREDAQLAAREAREAILRLKEENEALKMEIRTQKAAGNTRGMECSRHATKKGGDEADLLREQVSFMR